MEALEQYKAQRPPMDEDLKVQFPIIEELLSAMNVPVVRVKGWEGDDVLGTIAARDEALGFETLLVTGDKDAYQLATDKTRIVTTKKGITDVAIYGPAEVEERYGVRPDQFIDFLGLKGDSSDNIPGVPGIGDKTAAKLLQAYGSLEGIYEHVDELKGKQKEKIVENKDMAFLSREVATIVRDLDFPLDLEGCSFPSFDPDAVTEAFRKVRFNAHLNRVLKLVGQGAGKKAAALAVEPVVTGPRRTRLWTRPSRAARRWAWRSWSRSRRRCSARGCTARSARARAPRCSRTTPAWPRSRASCARGVRRARRQADVHRVYPGRHRRERPGGRCDLMGMRAFDLGLAGYVLNSSVAEYSFDALLGRLLRRASARGEGRGRPGRVRRPRRRARSWGRSPRRSSATAAAARTSTSTCPSWRCSPSWSAPARRWTATAWRSSAPARRSSSTICAARIFDMAGEEFNLDSPKQLSRILFEVLGLTPLKKNQRGYSTDAAVLKELAKEHELPALVLRYRELAKIKSTYIDALPRMRAGRRARAHLLQRDGHHHRPPVLVGSQPAEHPRAHGVRPPDQGVLRAARAGRALPVGRLLADRAEAARAPLGRRASGGRLLLGRRLPRRHGGARVRACPWRRSRPSCAAARRP